MLLFVGLLKGLEDGLKVNASRASEGWMMVERWRVLKAQQMVILDGSSIGGLICKGVVGSALLVASLC